MKEWAVLMNFSDSGNGNNEATIKYAIRTRSPASYVPQDTNVSLTIFRFRKFVAMLLSKKTPKGMQLGEPTVFKHLVSSAPTNTRKKIEDVWKETFAKFHEDGIKFVLYFDPLKDKRSHGKLS